MGDKEELGITCALIPTSHPGVQIGDRHFPMNMAFMNGTTYGKDVFIPLDWIIGGPSLQVVAGGCWWNVCRQVVVFLCQLLALQQVI
ncbi:MAG: hypothetical protein U5L01_14225 [Rheinheimera sp.]|nr:hypothetical protein [Rheinheimera sp.]